MKTTITLTKPMILAIENNDIISINNVRYLVNSVIYDEQGLFAVGINATKFDSIPVYEFSGCIKEER